MKYQIAFILSFLFTLNNFAQSEAELVGTWIVANAVNEDGGECTDAIKSAFKLTFLENGKFLKEEFSWDGNNPIKTQGEYAIIDKEIRLAYLLGAFVAVRAYPIIKLNNENLIISENLCPLRDEISNPELVLIRML